MLKHLWWAALLLGNASHALADDVIDSPMYRSPDVPTATTRPSFGERLLPLWLESLGRPEGDLKIRAALSIAEGHRRGMKGLEAAIAPLANELESAVSKPEVRTAIANALVRLDAKSTASALWRAAADGNADVRDIVEPAAARWNYEPARADWLTRINKAEYRQPMLLAIKCLGIVREEKAATRLRELVLNRSVPAPVRLEAARALAVIRQSGSESDASQLMGDAAARGMIDRTCAAALLRQHKSDESIRHLQTLGRDAEPSIAAVALSRLIEIDPKLVIPLLDTSLVSPDAKVRGLGVEVLFRQPTIDSVGLLGQRLNDPHPDVRAQARGALRDLDARTELRESVRRVLTDVLAGPDWRGQEQSAILAGEIAHKPAAAGLLKLLNGNRAEAIVAAAWALRRLALPETLAPVFEYVQLTYRRMLAAGPTAGRPTISDESLDRQLSQLAQMLGQGRYRPADELLRRFIPPTAPSEGPKKGASQKNPVGFETRTAGIWALGMINEGSSVSAISGPLAGRVSAVNPMDVEDERVRRMSAISLGRMKSTDSLPTLRKFYSSGKPSLDVVNNACGWAIEQITGEKMPPAGIVDVFQAGWALAPIQ